METRYILGDMIGIHVNMRGSSRNHLASGLIRWCCHYQIVVNCKIKMYYVCIRLHTAEDHLINVWRTWLWLWPMYPWQLQEWFIMTTLMPRCLHSQRTGDSCLGHIRTMPSCSGVVVCQSWTMLGGLSLVDRRLTKKCQNLYWQSFKMFCQSMVLTGIRCAPATMTTVHFKPKVT